MTASATDEPAPHRVVPGDLDDGVPGRALDRQPSGRPTLTSRPSTVPATPCPACRAEALDLRQRSPRAAGPVGDGARDRVLGAVLDGARQPQHLVGVLAVGGHHVGEGHLAGRHGAGLVEHDGVDAPGRLEHLGTLDEDAELGAAAGADHEGGRRRQPERARARDDQHGDRGGEGGGRPAPLPIQKPRVRDGERDHDRHEDAGDPVGEPLHLGLAVLGVLDEPRHLRELGVGSDAGGADDEPSAGVDGGADDGVTDADLDRDRLAGQHRGVDRGRAALDRRRRWRSSRRAGPRTCRRPTSCSVGIRSSDASAQHRHVLGAELEQGPQRRTGPRLERASK